MTRDEMIKAVNTRLPKGWASDIGQVIDALESMKQVKCDPPPTTPRDKAVAALLYLQFRVGQCATMQVTGSQADDIVSRLEEAGLSFVLTDRG